MPPLDAPDPATFLPLPVAAFQILLSLADQDRHGYSIMQDVATRTRGSFRLGPATLYTTIKRLLADGFVEEVEDRSSGDERRRYYKLTRFGRRVAKAELARLQSLVAQARSTLSES